MIALNVGDWVRSLGDPSFGISNKAYGVVIESEIFSDKQNQKTLFPTFWYKVQWIGELGSYWALPNDIQLVASAAPKEKQ